MHRKLYTLDDDEIRDEIKRRKKLWETKEGREQLVRQIAEEEKLPLEYCNMEVVDDALNPISIKKQLVDDDQIYKRKIELEKIISNVLEKRSVREDSLSKDNRELLKLYRNEIKRRKKLCKTREDREQLVRHIAEE